MRKFLLSLIKMREMSLKKVLNGRRKWLWIDRLCINRRFRGLKNIKIMFIRGLRLKNSNREGNLGCLGHRIMNNLRLLVMKVSLWNIWNIRRLHILVNNKNGISIYKRIRLSIFKIIFLIKRWLSKNWFVDVSFFQS